jgi:hypothetical protein
MTDTAIKVDGLSDLELERCVHLGMELDHAFKDNGELVALMSKQIFEIVD